MSDPTLLRLLARGLGDIEEWRLGDAERAAALGFPRQYATPVLDDWGIVFVDVTLDVATGEPVCHEVNGPNGVGSDALTGDSERRAGFEVCQAIRRAREQGHVTADGSVVQPIVTIHAHQHWSAFRTAGEFYPRVGRFAEVMVLSVLSARVELRGAGDPLGDEDVSVVLGDVPGVAEQLHIDPTTGRFRYQDRPVVFIGNPNLLSELVRVERLAPDRGRGGGVDLRVFHAWRLVHIIHDKAQQQELLEGTGLRPLRNFEAANRDDAARATRAALVDGPVVLKPNGTSGGAGVHVVTPTMTDTEIRARVDAVVDDCVRKYGANTEPAVLPIRGFEFVQSTPYPLSDGGHLWDLRIAVEFEPGVAHAYPVSIRLAPEPFDLDGFADDRDQWISNVSGRQVTLLKWGLDLETLEAVGFTTELLDRVVDSCATWTQKAWDVAARGADHGAVYEDAAERTDRDFYPREKFASR